MNPPYAVFLGIDDDGYPVLLDARKKKGFLFSGDIDFEYIKSMTLSQSRIEFVTITKDDFRSDTGWQKILAVGVWIREGGGENYVLILESLGEVSFLTMSQKRHFVQLFDRITILAKSTGKSILSTLFEENIIKIGAKYLYMDRGEQRWFSQFTPDKILELE